MAVAWETAFFSTSPPRQSCYLPHLPSSGCAYLACASLESDILHDREAADIPNLHLRRRPRLPASTVDSRGPQTDTTRGEIMHLPGTAHDLLLLWFTWNIWPTGQLGGVVATQTDFETRLKVRVVHQQCCVLLTPSTFSCRVALRMLCIRASDELIGPPP